VSALDFPAWRSLLYVPANVERFVARAHAAGADAVILDLEDAVAPDQKAAARRSVGPAAAQLVRYGIDVMVRINRPLTLAVDDLAGVVGPDVGCLVLPKVMGPDHLRLLSEVVTECEVRHGVRAGTTRFVVIIETAEAVLRVREIAHADPRIVALTLGTEDLATELHVDPAADVLAAHHAALIAAAVDAAVLPLGLVGSIAEFRDLAAFGAIARRSGEYGYRGSACIHPAQIPILNAAFTPALEEVERARKIVAAYDAAQANGQGAIALDGRMIDVPVAQRAHALLKTYEAISSRHDL
jgi:citrate lyase subunit beta/citryl-CoA lyase